MSNPENFEVKELSGEIIKEWYHEKGISPEEFEKKEPKKREEEEPLSPPQFIPQSSPDPEELKRQEEEKKLLVKSKVKELLKLAEEKGLEKSIREAEKENNPFLLDIYHDVLAKDGAYKKFLSR